MSKVIKLTGRHAVGESSYAIVDDDMFDYLNQFAWKAKPNGRSNNVYAVRNTKTSDGKNVTIRMHRVVADYAGPLDIDHINHNSLDNRKNNLRIASRSENTLNRKEVSVECVCRRCGKAWMVVMKAGSRRRVRCSAECAKEEARDLRVKTPASAVVRKCQWCDESFSAAASHQRYCSESCRKSAKWIRQRQERSVLVCDSKVLPGTSRRG